MLKRNIHSFKLNKKIVSTCLTVNSDKLTNVQDELNNYSIIHYHHIQSILYYCIVI